MGLDPPRTGFRSPARDEGAAISFQSRMHRVFLGPNGIRAGWRILYAICMWVFFSSLLTILLLAIPAIRLWVSTQNLRVMTPSLLLFLEGTSAVAAILSALVIALIEKRSFADYGLPLRGALGKRLGQGLLLGFAMVSALIGLIAAMNGFSPGQPVLAGGDAVRFGLLYMLGFLLLGFYEEFSFRGYLQATLTSGIGFWPAAVLLAIAFGGGHFLNAGERGIGLLTAGCFGLLAAFSLRRTGDIWLAIGMHASWDWGQTYLYSVPDSGILAKGHLLNSSFHGPNWLTGGSVGPEGSLFVFAVLALAALVIHYMFPAKQEVR